MRANGGRASVALSDDPSESGAPCGAAGGRQAASELCQAYGEPVRAFLLGQGAQHQEIDDITQGLFEDLYRRRDFSKFDPARGRFRSWLCACAKHYLYNLRDRQSSQAAGGGHAHTSLDAAVAEERLEPQELRTPEQLFYQRWAVTVVARSLSRLRSHYATRGEEELFQSLEGTLSGEGGELSDADLSELLGKSEGAVRKSRHDMKVDMRRRYGKYLREEVGKTVSDPGAIDDEIRELLAALG